MPFILPDICGRDIRSSAVLLAEAGWRVVPFRADRSRAHVRYADLPARTSGQVKRDYSKWPDALLAIHLSSEIAVLDLDPRTEPLATIRGELKRRFSLPTCPEIETPKGGRHMWFRLPKGVTARNWTNLHGKFPVPCVDIRTYRGLAILPPSRRKDGSYSWHHWQADIPFAPEELCGALASPSHKSSSDQTARPTSAFSGGSSPYVRAILKGELERAGFAPKGSRNHALFVASAKLGGLHAEGQIPDVRNELLLMARLSGLIADDGEAAARATVRSGWSRGMQCDSVHFVRFDNSLMEPGQ